MVAEVLKLGTYKLANEKGTVFTNAWNNFVASTIRASKLCICYEFCTIEAL